MEFSLLGIPWDFTTLRGMPGSRYAPAAVRQAFAKISARLESGAVFWLDRQLVVDLPARTFFRDEGDVELAAHDVARSFREISRRIGALWRSQRVPIALGGDDAVTFPVVRGLHDATEGSWGMIHLDAHLDLLDDSPFSGRLSHSSGVRRVTELQRFRPDQLIQVGVRNVNLPSSAAFIQQRGSHLLPASEFARVGVRAAAERALAAVAQADFVHLAVDIDVLDPGFAPGTDSFEAGGLSPRELFDFVCAVAPRTAALSLVEVNPLTDHRNQTAALAANLIAQFVLAKVGAQPAG